MADTSVPSGFGGGLMRYNEEYDSKLKITPSQVILFVILSIIFVIALNIFM